MEKFAVPRQPGLVKSVQGTVLLEAPYNEPSAFDGLKEFSHIWLLFRFHQNLEQGWKPGVRPPRLGGNKKIGVFATRSSFRPNGLGMSVVKLLNIEFEQEQTRLTVSGIDLVSGTPIYDIKPYIPYSDAIPGAHSGFVHGAPEQMLVTFSAEAAQWLAGNRAHFPDLKIQIIEVLAQDPRPAYRKLQRVDCKVYGTAFAGLNIKWQATAKEIEVLQIQERKI